MRIKFFYKATLLKRCFFLLHRLNRKISWHPLKINEFPWFSFTVSPIPWLSLIVLAQQKPWNCCSMLSRLQPVYPSIKSSPINSMIDDLKLDLKLNLPNKLVKEEVWKVKKKMLLQHDTFLRTLSSTFSRADLNSSVTEAISYLRIFQFPSIFMHLKSASIEKTANTTEREAKPSLCK